MDAKGLARYAPLTGLGAVVLWIVGIVVSETGNPPGDKASGAEIAASFDRDSTRILIAATLFGLGSAAFIWFLGSLTARLRATVGDGRLASIVFAAGTAAATMWACVVAPSAAGALAFENRNRDLSPAAAEALEVLGDGFFLVAEFLAVAFMGAAALAILRGRAFPAWFGWVTALIAVVLIVGPIGWAALILGVPLWTIVVSVWLFVTQERVEVPQAAAPASS
jgi:hypothetical protein